MDGDVARTQARGRNRQVHVDTALGIACVALEEIGAAIVRGERNRRRIRRLDEHREGILVDDETLGRGHVLVVDVDRHFVLDAVATRGEGVGNLLAIRIAGELFDLRDSPVLPEFDDRLEGISLKVDINALIPRGDLKHVLHANRGLRRQRLAAHIGRRIVHGHREDARDRVRRINRDAIGTPDRDDVRVVGRIVRAADNHIVLERAVLPAILEPEVGAHRRLRGADGDRNTILKGIALDHIAGVVIGRLEEHEAVRRIVESFSELEGELCCLALAIGLLRMVWRDLNLLGDIHMDRECARGFHSGGDTVLIDDIDL